MSFFTSYFGIADLGNKEQNVLCPFPHTTGSETYTENRPSAHVNTEGKVFHCKACNTGLTEMQFISKVLGCDQGTALKLQRLFERSDISVEEWTANTPLYKETEQRAQELGISDAVVKSLGIRSLPLKAGKGHAVLYYPIAMYDTVLDERYYNKGGTPKCEGKSGAMTGLIHPFQNLLDTKPNQIIYICEGEKDLSVALTHGLNAIQITGGAGPMPVCPELFRDKKVVFFPDNDDPGKSGAEARADFLHPYAALVGICTGFHEICKEKGEDLTDFFMKYGGTKKQLLSYVNQVQPHVPTKRVKEKHLDIVTLYNATQPKYANKLVKTPIQVVGVEDRAFVCPTSIIVEKTKNGENATRNFLNVGDIREWQLTPNNIEDMILLVEECTEKERRANILKLCRIPEAEENIRIRYVHEDSVYKAAVTDLLEFNSVDNDEETHTMEFAPLILGQRLESGKKYLVTHKMTPHPKKGQQLVMVITDVEESNDSITTFTLDEQTKNNLREFQNKPFQEIAEKMKHYIGFDVNSQLLETIDLAFHTPLQFQFGTKLERATLDTIIIGESRIGKSDTAKSLQKTYGLGTVVSLAGGAATMQGLIGGSSPVGKSGAYQIRSGIIPQNHKSLVVFEELGKANNDIIKELTDVRSSGLARITRVSSSVQIPALVRMISLTNPKGRGGHFIPISSASNGLEVIMGLVDKAEDIARYDVILVSNDKGAEHIDPLWKAKEPFSEEALQTRIRWIWSRKPEQIVIDEALQKYIYERSNDLNKLYGCSIKIFGTEAWKKICRVAIAMAGYCVSTDETFEKIILKKTFVDAAINWLVKLYHNDVFRLHKIVEEERALYTTNDAVLAILQEVYNKSKALIKALSKTTMAPISTLQAQSGLNKDVLNQLLQKMAEASFITFCGHDIRVETRFRLTEVNLNRATQVEAAGTETPLMINTTAEVDDDF